MNRHLSRALSFVFAVLALVAAAVGLAAVELADFLQRRGRRRSSDRG